MRIAILDDYQHVARDMAPWDRLGPGHEVVVLHEHLHDDDALVARVQSFDVIVAMRERTPFRAAVLHRLPQLRLLVTTGMRNASIDSDAAAQLGIAVCGTGSLNYPTAELAFGHILALARRIPAEDRALREGRWQTSIGLGLDGKTLGVIGLGRLGGRVASYGHAFNMNVVAWSQNLTDERAQAGGARRVAFHDLLGQSDFVTIHLVLGERTRGLVGAAELAKMKPGAFLINTSRAPIVDYAALADALSAGRLAGAGIDVYDDEPLPHNAPIRSAPNTVLTPHLGYVTVETYRLFYGEALEDIEAFLRGTPVRLLNAPAALRAR